VVQILREKAKKSAVIIILQIYFARRRRPGTVRYDWIAVLSSSIQQAGEDDLLSSALIGTVRVPINTGSSDPLNPSGSMATASLNKPTDVMSIIESRFDSHGQITGESITLPSKRSGKVRDQYLLNNNTIALVTTDRQSGFDRMLALVPFKGQVLNLTSQFWFEKTQEIIPNHLIEVPHPNVSIVKKCTPFPIEFVVRSYMTGSTNTSIWKNYQSGVRNYCGHVLPVRTSFLLYSGSTTWKFADNNFFVSLCIRL